MTILAVVVAGTAVPTTTNVGRPAKVARAIETPRPSIGGQEPRPGREPQRAAAPTTAPSDSSVSPIPGGGYVLPDGHFRVDADARAILDFALQSRCAGSIDLPPIRVDATGGFDFAGHPPGSPAGTIVRTAGRFVSSREVQGTTQISRGNCRGARLSFVAHLS